MADGPAALDDLWHGERYEDNTAHHRRHDPPFLSPLDVVAGQAVLDVGCGDGSLTARLAARSPDVEFLGIDAAPDMIATAEKRAAANLRFALRRAQQIDFVEEFDVILSVAALHWVAEGDHPAFLSRARVALRPGGRLLLEFGGEGNVTRTLEAIGDVASREPYRRSIGDLETPWFFPSAGTYAELVTDAGLVVDEAALVTQPREFSEEEFRGWLDTQTLLPWLARLDTELRAGFADESFEAAARAAESDDIFHETFARVRLEAHRPGSGR